MPRWRALPDELDPQVREFAGQLRRLEPPRCLGIAQASGAPLFSGIVTGIVAGIIVGFLSGSQLSVAGPAAGLTAIVLAAISDLGSWEIFLCAVMANVTPADSKRAK